MLNLNWYLIFTYALGMSFVLSLALTGVMRVAARRWNIMDHPGERKMHSSPMPLLGGVAIWLTFYLMIFGHVLIAIPFGHLGSEWISGNVVSFLRENLLFKLTGIFAGGLIIFVLGVVDDLKSLRPETKLVGQIVAALALVIPGIRLDIFNGNVWVTGAITVVWVVMMTNSMNFLDNMDGLCAGVSGIAAISFFLCVEPHGQTFVCIMLMIFTGAVGGFLYHNLSPAKIFMGDAGSMFCGYILATVAVLGTFYTGAAPSRVAIAAPLLALSVPIFDTISVVYIRWRNGESIMKGDKRHFSHRLVALGMSPRQAVEFIFLVAAVTGLGAALLPHVSLAGTFIILAQTVGIFLLIVLIMVARSNSEGSPR